MERRLKEESGAALIALREEFGIINDLRQDASPTADQDAPRLPRQSLVSPTSRSP